MSFSRFSESTTYFFYCHAWDLLQGRLDRYKAANDALGALEQATKVTDKEFRRLAGIKEDSDPPFDLDKLVPPPVNAPKNLDRGLHQQPKEEFEVAGATHVFSTFHIDEDDPLQLVDLVLRRGHESRGGRLILNSQMDDKRAALLL